MKKNETESMLLKSLIVEAFSERMKSPATVGFVELFPNRLNLNILIDAVEKSIFIFIKPFAIKTGVM